MKTLLLTTALAAGFALPAMAQDAASPFQTEAAGPSLAASEVIGARIYASEGAVDADAYSGVQEGWEDIGEVNDIILGRDGTVDAVLVDIGGFLGMGERQIAVDMAALKVVQDDATDADDWFLVLQSDRATLEGAPEYVMPGAAATDANATDANATDANATDANATDANATDANATDATTGDQAATDTAATDTTTQGTATDETVAESTTAEGTEGTGNATDTALPADGDGSTETATAPAANGMALPEGYTEMDREGLTAELLTGADVRDSNDASIAEVQDLVLTAEGQVTDVVLDVGGFLGIGARSVAIPMDRLTVAQTEGGAVRLWVNMTKEELEALPEYEK